VVTESPPQVTDLAIAAAAAAVHDGLIVV
jgi:hypothetical protein